MTSVREWRTRLGEAADPAPFLLAHSGLQPEPGRDTFERLRQRSSAA
jgi:hypothetical protein